jgi:hypothetical protein
VKLLFENWRKMLESDVVDFPSNMNMVDIYSLYKEHIEEALAELQRIEDLFRERGGDLESIQNIKTQLEAAKENEMLDYDVENF